MRPATYEPEQIIEAGLALQAEGRNITWFALRNQVGGGNPTRLRQIWDEYQASQSTVVTEPVAELPVEVAEEVKAVSAALSERITQLATELNDKAVRAAERRVAEVTRAAGEQTAQAERELADTAQTVDDLEEKLDELQDGYDRLTLALETAKDMHWNYRLLSDREWSGRNAVALSAGVNGIYLSRANLDVAFDDSGRQINPLTARLTGNVAGVMKLLIAVAGRQSLSLVPPCPTSIR
ncbi:DUF2913 family protein [Salmonella enterica]|nr:DUF2913 family protein [Salmonella enterica]EGA7976714.1 hypothetical protein [Salmonella enterica]EGB1240254.1 hypothetical protein [Salmonella enterica]